MTPEIDPFESRTLLRFLRPYRTTRGTIMQHFTELGPLGWHWQGPGWYRVKTFWILFLAEQKEIPPLGLLTSSVEMTEEILYVAAYYDNIEPIENLVGPEMKRHGN